MKRFRYTYIVMAAVTAAIAIIAFSCSGENRSAADGNGPSEDSSSHRFPDTLRVATLYSPSSYFIYRETPMCYDYDLVKRLAEDKKMVLDLHVAPNLNAMV